MLAETEIFVVNVIFAVVLSLTNSMVLKDDKIMAVNQQSPKKRFVEKMGDEDKEDSAFASILKIDQALGLDLFEGDIKLDKMGESFVKENPDEKEKRAMHGYQQKLWTTRVVPYEIIHPGTSRHSSTEVHQRIKEAHAEIEKVTCIHFRPKIASDRSWIRYEKKSGCYSEVGRSLTLDQFTEISLGEGCISISIILHETLHALGFWHEQNRPDRNSFVKISWENIYPGVEDNFQRHKSYDARIQDTTYDYESIMHYSRTAFNTNGKNTIEAIHDPNVKLGGKQLSALDIIEINKMYQCNAATKTSGYSEWSKWSSCFKTARDNVGECSNIRQRFCFDQNCQGVDLYGVQTEFQKCQSCQDVFDGHWGQWGSWSSCSKTCDEGIFTRKRNCDNPAPSAGGKQCIGESSHSAVCRLRRCNQQSYDTSFENGWGIWSNEAYSDNFDWTRHSESTPTSGTGPDGDHTTGNGYYIYAESGTTRYNQVAKLKSSMIPANFGEKCLSFFYSMNGKDMGTLEVFLRLASGSYINLGWKRSGHQGKDWQAGALTLPKLSEGYQIYFEAKILYSPNSDIALDDIYIDHGACIKGIEGCSDHYEQCQTWASIGECHLNPTWMVRSCCRACSGQCILDADETNCPGWATTGYCNQSSMYYNWMTANCCKSCRECRDKHTECPNWASTGECTKNPTWMATNCATSCKICPT